MRSHRSSPWRDAAPARCGRRSRRADPSVPRQAGPVHRPAGRVAAAAHRRGRPVRGRHVRLEPHLPAAVRGTSCRAPAGETVALISASGAGKSTCARLLLRWSDPSAAGSRSADRRSRASRCTNYRACRLRPTGHLPVQLLGRRRHPHGPARHDRGHGRARRSRRARARLHRVRAGDGYDTIVGERGAQLSVPSASGSRSPAHCSRCAILVLDEAVSNLDAESEAALEAAIQRRGRSGRASSWRTALAIRQPTR